MSHDRGEDSSSQASVNVNNISVINRQQLNVRTISD